MRRLDDLREYACTCISQDLTSVAAVSWYSGGFPLFFSLHYFLEVTQASQPDRRREAE